jgi:non-ribosomal peptide synthetase component F
LRSSVDTSILFTDLLQQVKATTLEAYEHQDVPFEKVVDAVVKERDLSRSPLFQVMFVLQNLPEVPEVNLGEAKLVLESFEQNISKFEITCFITETSDGMEGTFQYNTDLYDDATMARMIAHYKELLTTIAHAPSQTIGAFAHVNEGG